MSRAHAGAATELRASALLLEYGFHVFSNVSAHGPVDMTVWHPETGKTALIDIKTRTGNKQPSGTYWNNSSPSKASGVHILQYAPDADHWWWHPAHGVPEGLEVLGFNTETP